MVKMYVLLSNKVFYFQYIWLQALLSKIIKLYTFLQTFASSRFRGLIKFFK